MSEHEIIIYKRFLSWRLDTHSNVLKVGLGRGGLALGEYFGRGARGLYSKFSSTITFFCLKIPTLMVLQMILALASHIHFIFSGWYTQNPLTYIGSFCDNLFESIITFTFNFFFVISCHARTFSIELRVLCGRADSHHYTQTWCNDTSAYHVNTQFWYKFTSSIASRW